MATNKRPIMAIPMSSMDWIPECLALLALLFTVYALADRYPALPDTVPTHFNVGGSVDGWGSKKVLFIMPTILLGVNILLTSLYKHPHTYNYPVAITEENARRQYALAVSFMRWLKAEVTLIFSYVEWNLIQSALSSRSTLSIWSIPVIPLAILGSVIAYISMAVRQK